VKSFQTDAGDHRRPAQPWPSRARADGGEGALCKRRSRQV
jgi:hypothetical protein